MFKTLRFISLVLVVHAFAAQAEAGLPWTFCTQNSCTCGTSTCSCGQVCNYGGAQGGTQCLSAQAGFCTADSQCAASCDQFICEGNVCVKGVRPDAGHCGTTPVPFGCSSASGLFTVLSAVWLAVRRRAPTARR